MCQDFSLVISTERTLADKVKMFKDKCADLEQALESANNVSSVEIRALKRDIVLGQEKNDNLTKAYDELKKEHEAMIFAKETDVEKLKKEHAKVIKESSNAKKDLEAQVSELRR